MAKKEEKDAQILDAATTEFLCKGFDAASMQNIADTAEVSKRTLYKYYPSKDELFDALVEEILDRIENLYQLDVSGEKSIAEQIEGIVAAKIELTLTESFLNISKIVLGELLKSRRPKDEHMVRLNQSEAQFVDWIRTQQEQKNISGDMAPEDIADQFHSILKGQTYWPILFGWKKIEDLDLEKIKKSTVQFFINSFCKPIGPS